MFDYPRVEELGKFLHDQCMAAQEAEVAFEGEGEGEIPVRVGGRQKQIVLEMSEAEALEALLAELED